MFKRDLVPRKFYIAHRILERKQVKAICKRLQDAGIDTVNPFYLPDGSGRPERPEIQKIDEGKMDPYYIRNVRKARDIVEADLKHIDNADGTIAFINQGSIGTAMECFYTAWVLHKPLFVITEKYNRHAWIMTFATGIFKNEDEFIKWYKKKYGKKIDGEKKEEIKIDSTKTTS